MAQRIPHQKPTKREIRETRAFYGFITPLLIGWVIFLFGPLVYSFYLSFTRYDILTTPVFIGFENFEGLARDERLITALKNTFYFVLVFVPSSTLLSLLLAMLLNNVHWGKGLFRAIFYLPAILPSVSTTLLFMWVLNYKYGPINLFLRFLHLTPVAWLSDANLMKPSLVFMMLWGFGASMLIFLAGLQAIPSEYYEASAIDGASGWKQFWLITLPLLSPTTLFVVITKIIAAFQVFTTAYVLTNGSGGPKDALLFVVLYLYTHAFKLGNFGYASAIAWMLAIIIATFTIISLRVSEKFVYYELSSQDTT
jgi:multiple sugar transport system permease protein